MHKYLNCNDLVFIYLYYFSSQTGRRHATVPIDHDHLEYETKYYISSTLLYNIFRIIQS